MSKYTVVGRHLSDDGEAFLDWVEVDGDAQAAADKVYNDRDKDVDIFSIFEGHISDLQFDNPFDIWDEDEDGVI